MARSWQYPRWRRIVVQVLLWVILGGTLALAQLVVRHRQLVGSVELSPMLTVDLPTGVVAGVRLPKGWPVDNDPAEHGIPSEQPDVVRSFQAHESVIDAEGEPGHVERTLVILFQPLGESVTARSYMKSSRVVSDGMDLPSEMGGGRVVVAGVEGYARMGRPVGSAGGQVYAAVGVVPAGEDEPTPVAVTVLLYGPAGGLDDRNDIDLLRRVAAAVTVQGNRAPAVPTSRPARPVR